MNNSKELIKQILEEVSNGAEGQRFNIDNILDEYLPLLTVRKPKSFFVRFWFRSQITSAFNAHDIFSCNTERDDKKHKEKGYFISIFKANLSQLAYFMKKANRDFKGVEKRKTKIIERQGQISLLINEKNELELDIPEAINL